MVLLAIVSAHGCGRDEGRCSTACEPACEAGTVCSGDLRGHITAARRGVCLARCAHPDDCPSGLRCRSFGPEAPFVCASDAVPELCATDGTVIDDIVGDGSSCVDAQTIALPFESVANQTRGWELSTCAGGCETVSIDGLPTSRCRGAP